MKIYITMMYRYGNYEAHNYPIAVSLFKRCAIAKGEAEAQYRGGKYEYEVISLGLFKRSIKNETRRLSEDNLKRRFEEAGEWNKKYKPKSKRHV